MPPLLAAALVVFFEGLGFGIILPVLAPFARELGGPAMDPHKALAWAGLLFALSTIPRAFFGPLWGRLSDVIGRRWMLAFATVGTLASSLLWAECTHLGHFAMTGLLWLLVSRCVYGVFASQSILSLAVASDVSAPEKRAHAMGMIGAAFGLSFTLGPALGGWFAERYGSVNIGWLCAASQLMSMGVILFALRETHPHHVKGETTVFEKPSNLLHLAGRSRVMWLMLITLLSTIAYSVMLPTYEPLAKTWFNWDKAHVGYALAVFGLVGAFVQGGMIRPAVKRLGEKATAMIGAVILAAGLAWIAMTPGLAGFWGATVLIAIGTGFAVPSITALMSLSAGEADQGAIHGLNYSATSLGRGAGYLVVTGTAYLAAGPAATYVIAAVASLIAGAMLLNSRVPARKTAEPVGVE